MNFKNIILSIILSICSLFVFGQFSIKTEYEYLKLINNQHRKDLINDNIKNAEIAANNFIISDNNKYQNFFFTELSKSHNIIKNKELSFYYNIVQRVLFANDSISIYSKNIFLDNAFSVNLNDSTTSEYWKKTSKNNLPQALSDKIILILELSTQLHSDALTKHIYALGLKLRQQNAIIPSWYQHWEFLSIIGFNEKQKSNFLSNNTKKEKTIFELVNKKQKNKIYSKAIKYYIKSDAKRHATELLSEYKKLDLSIFRKLDASIKKIRI